MKCFICKKKITLAMSLSTSKCECDQLFCTEHKAIHINECLFFLSKLESNKNLLKTKLLQIKSVDSGNLSGRI